MTEDNKRFYIMNNKFVTEEQYTSQQENNRIVCDYLGLFCRMHDVVRLYNQKTNELTYVAPGDEYEPYYYKLEYPGDINPWTPKKGSLKWIYSELEKNGVDLSTTMYTDPKQKILK